MLGGRNGVPAWGVHDDDTAAGCCAHVHIINSDARPPNDLQLFGRIDYFRRDFGLRANDNRGILRYDTEEVVFFQPRFDLNEKLPSCFQQFDPFG